MPSIAPSSAWTNAKRRSTMPAREKTPAKPSSVSGRLKFVEAIKGRRGEVFLYYRRDGRRIPLPAPEGSAAFLDAYDAADRLFRKSGVPAGRTVDEAIGAYISSVDFGNLAPASQRDYRRTLSQFRIDHGSKPVSSFGEAEIEVLREIHGHSPVGWNSLRSRMIAVVSHYRRINPNEMAVNPWLTSRRLPVKESNAHRPWSADVLLAVMRAATPEYRALLTGYLLTAQRGGDVTSFKPGQYDAAKRTLSVVQEKTEEPILLHVPESLAATLSTMAGNKVDRLFVTPRGYAWDLKNAQETLRTLLRNLGLPRYTLHGLRATGPTALKLLGFENRAIRALTGHTSDKNLEVYLRGVEHYPLARQAQEALEGQFAALLSEAGAEGNRRRFSGVTGRAASTAKRLPNSQSESKKM
jgi:integrase